MDSGILKQLNDLLIDLNRNDGIESCLITDLYGNVISSSTSRDSSLFGHMANVITASSKKMLNSTNQGGIERVLLESKDGKALFLSLGDLNLVLILDVTANVGFVMVSAKRAALKIEELSRDIILEKQLQKEAEIEDTLEKSELEQDKMFEVIQEITGTEEVLDAFDEVVGIEKLEEMMDSSEFKSLDMDDAKDKLSKILENNKEHLGMDGLDVNGEIINPEEESEIRADENSETMVPIIKPPISFPMLPDVVQIPESPEERSNLVLDIYEAIFLAMSIGASKIMGVSPARGLINRFLPYDDCEILLKDVEIKNNSVVDFDKIRENAEDILLDKREDSLKSNLNKIINVITENFGKVMGYEAFRGIVRAEFNVIHDSYAKPMDALGIKDHMHPELVELFN